MRRAIKPIRPLSLTRGLCVAALVLGAGCGHAADAPWGGAPLAEWAGRYPTEADGKVLRLKLEQPRVKAALDVSLPREERRLLASYSNERKIERKEHYLVLHFCKPHDCGDNYAEVVIDLEAERVWAGFFNRARPRVSTRWYGNAEDYSVLPAELREAFAPR